MKKAVLAIALAAWLGPFWTQATLADAGSQLCKTRDEVASILALQHGELPVSGGIHGDDAVLELFVSEGSKTWSIIITQPDGTACLVAAGTDWMDESILPAGVPG